MDRIDGDADGYITTDELNAWIKRVQKRYVYENVAKVWADYDLNKDNKISWDEYKQATYGYYLGMAPLVVDMLLFKDVPIRLLLADTNFDWFPFLFV